MTMESEIHKENKFVRNVLPWLVALAAFVIYVGTLNHWVTINSLFQVAKISGWRWQPDLQGPVFWLATYPFHWLPASAIPVALNLFTAICAALVLALLTRSVSLLPHDRTHEQRQKEKSEFSLLSIPSAWLPPVLAAVICGLQLTFWENATVLSSGMLDLLLMAYVIRNLLEFRLDQQQVRLTRAAFVYGLAMTNNWVMIAFLPVFLVALVWMKGLSFLARAF